MLRSYNTTSRDSISSSSSRKRFTFNYIVNDNSKTNKITRQDIRILNLIETEINNQIIRVLGQAQGQIQNQYLSIGNGFIDTTNLHLVINRRLSLPVKNILNQYDIGHFEKSIWCGLRKSTRITFDKIIPRIISTSSRNNSMPLEHLISNAINISNSNIAIHTNSKSPNSPRLQKLTDESGADTYRHDYLNPTNKAQSRKLRSIYNE